ncbi:hypothetical protein K450DRAFT_247419 [Umbelopsis ramanniana AG]|uniref:Uncharacterized protein n=1 Tax=Umbelopsis ramanniana AG TaxID=1314678 RepID=A0AAD5E7W4_UMBRA|nr:uncharacterized protein K450DRAFT_247419 [Umbelopsis ramanniana AG]KAI8578329.1 hypothetical protein K450DRAFT_247419 [Umbelopsis ramanniana AG]
MPYHLHSVIIMKLFFACSFGCTTLIWLATVSFQHFCRFYDFTVPKHIEIAHIIFSENIY